MNEQFLTSTIASFLYDYADCLDSRRYQDWPGFFDPEQCHYEILSRENVDLGLPAAIMYCDSHGMIIDRVTMLQDALTYRQMWFRHFISNIRIQQSGAQDCLVQANYQVMQTDNDGVTSLYNVGQYKDDIVFLEQQPKFRKKTVIVDTFAIDNMLAVPL